MKWCKAGKTMQGHPRKQLVLNFKKNQPNAALSLVKEFRCPTCGKWRKFQKGCFVKYTDTAVMCLACNHLRKTVPVDKWKQFGISVLTIQLRQ